MPLCIDFVGLDRAGLTGVKAFSASNALLFVNDGGNVFNQTNGFHGTLVNAG